MKEIWKDVPNYEGIYQVSNLGRIKSLYFTSNIYKKKFYKEKILKPKKGKDNSLRIELWKDKKHKTVLLHRLIATTFMENLIDTNMTVNHKNGNRLDNRVENLEWLSRADNIRYGFQNGQYPQARSNKTYF
nr:MAG TPA: homing endonuclease [Caudoviricetes sp.]